MSKTVKLDFQRLFDALPNRYLVFTPDDPDFTFVAENHAHTLVAMVKPGEIIGKGFFDVFPDTTEKFLKTGVSDLAESIRSVIRTKQPDTMEALRYDIKNAKGKMIQRYWQATHYPLLDDDGEVAYVLQETRDITDSLIKGRELARVQKNLQDVLAIGSIGTWAWDTNDDVVHPDRNLAKMFGVDKSAVINGLPLEAFVNSIHEDDRAHVGELIQNAVKTKGKYEAEYRTVSTDGSILWVIARGAVEIDPETGHTLFPGVIVDVTERRKLQEDLKRINNELEQRVKDRTAKLKQSNLSLERSNEELQDFAYVASHDLQEPLRKIQAFSNLLVDEYGDQLEDGKDYLDRMRNAASRMSTLIEDLMQFSRVTTQAKPPETVDLNVIVAEVIGDLEIRLKDTGGMVESHDLPTITADPMQMRQLFQNLIANALKFHKPNEAPVVKIHAECSEPMGDTIGQCTVTVSDNGIGFDDKYAHKVFAVFQRLHGRDNYEGTGIGLAVCRKIVERHGGTIAASSQVGKGATFTITLPITK